MSTPWSPYITYVWYSALSWQRQSVGLHWFKDVSLSTLECPYLYDQIAPTSTFKLIRA